MGFEHLCILVLWTKVASALEGLRGTVTGTAKFQKVPYHNVSFLRGTLNDTNHCEVIIH